LSSLPDTGGLSVGAVNNRQLNERGRQPAGRFPIAVHHPPLLCPALIAVAVDYLRLVRRWLHFSRRILPCYSYCGYSSLSLSLSLSVVVASKYRTGPSAGQKPVTLLTCGTVVVSAISPSGVERPCTILPLHNTYCFAVTVCFDIELSS